MYNRYIPQNDGSYHRQQIQDPPRKNPHPPQQPAPPPPPVPAPCQNCPNNPRPKPTQPTGGMGVGSFLRGLLPGDFDTEDLIVILLLLLMAGDSQEDQNSALLTLALYLFL